MRSLALLATLGLAAAQCPNACNGNGICGANSKCSCYQNWQGADCSLRTCSFSLAWADTADGTNQAHYYAECGNKGTCDRKTGDCVCFEGYEGKGCRRSTCPEACSGHGTCEYIEELGGDFEDRRNGPGKRFDGISCSSQDPASCDSAPLKTSNVVARSADTDVYNGHLYQLWDAGKIQGCKCDLGYYGPDCASRTVPRGDDPLTTVKSETMKQLITIGLEGAATATDEFFLKFHDPYGGIWHTNTVDVVDSGTNEGDKIVAKKVQDQLRALPNHVLSDVVVSHVNAAVTGMNVCERFSDGVQHISAYSQTTDGNYKNSKGTTNRCKTLSGADATKDASETSIDLEVKMSSNAGQTGVQYLLEVDTNAHGAGSYPVSEGVTNGAVSSVVEINQNVNLVNLSELSDCSDRGLDNGDGECECFDGYRGVACEEQEALV